MNKYKVMVESIVEAKDRTEAWKVARQIFEQELDYIGQVSAITDPLPDPGEWYAINSKTSPNKALEILSKAQRS